MKRGAWRGLCSLLALMFVLPALAQTNAPQSASPENRYLLVVETARSMLRRGPATVNLLGGLLASGFNGQIHPGDSIGVWTFAEDLSTGHFPLQHWTPQTRTDIAERVVTFLNEQKYEKQSSFDKLLPALGRLVKDSPFITIVLVTDGEDKIVGTPFDSHINDTYQTWRERQQAAQMPFVTVLRAKQGVVTDYTVTPAPWAVEMPPLPPELRVTTVVAQQATIPKPAAPTVPPLIIHGKKPEPVEVAPPASAPQATNSAAAASAATAVVMAQQASPVTSASNGTTMPQPAAALSANASTNLAAAVPAQTPPAVAAPTVASPSASAPPRKAAALPAPAATHRKGIWLAVAAVATALLGLAMLLFLRARSAPATSLITQSLERQAK